MNRIARERDEPFLTRYGGQIGLEWFFPKMLETIEKAPEVADGALRLRVCLFLFVQYAQCSVI